MLEIKPAVVPLDAAEVMTLERIITDADEKEALSFLKKSIYGRILQGQQGALKSHLDSSDPVKRFISQK